LLIVHCPLTVFLWLQTYSEVPVFYCQILCAVKIKLLLDLIAASLACRFMDESLYTLLSLCFGLLPPEKELRRLGGTQIHSWITDLGVGGGYFCVSW